MSRSAKGAVMVLPSAIVGVGLSGFFDGILLHQVLQWHHLLSLVPGEPFRDIGTQVLADGLFHVLMYLITAIGLWLLWRRRAALDEPGSWRGVAGGGLFGFGLWNVIDVGFFHWTLGIHRIRVNVSNPMLYDVSWLLGLGLVPIGLAWLILRRGNSNSSPHGRAVAASFAFLVCTGAMLAAKPQSNSNTALVVFTPGKAIAPVFNVASAASARIVWMDPRGRMMAITLPDRKAERRLYAAGALLVTRSPILAGCTTALTA